MNNFFIVIPTFNDWRSLNKVLQEIDKKVYKIKGKFTVIVINDASTIKPNLKIKHLKKLKKIIVITNKKNLGSQKSIYLGLKYLKKIKKKSIITVMDSDGEDDPKKIKERDTKEYKWLHELLDLMNTSSSQDELIENSKIKLFEDNIYVFSPKGDILELPKNATPIDFAYSIHSEVGDKCVASKIN